MSLCTGACVGSPARMYSNGLHDMGSNKVVNISFNSVGMTDIDRKIANF